MLSAQSLVAFVPVRDLAVARAFYAGVLDLRIVREDTVAIVLDANGVTVRLASVAGLPDFRPASYTVLGWRVADVSATVHGLASRGVSFVRYPGMQQDALGIWTSPGGARVAWFHDPDGNVLSLTED